MTTRWFPPECVVTPATPSGWWYPRLGSFDLPMNRGERCRRRCAAHRLVPECGHQVEPDPAEMAAQCGAETPVLDWRERLLPCPCGSRQVEMVASARDRIPIVPSGAVDAPLMAREYRLALGLIPPETSPRTSALAPAWRRFF
jgi:hypothetical protein